MGKNCFSVAHYTTRSSLNSVSRWNLLDLLTYPKQYAKRRWPLSVGGHGVQLKLALSGGIWGMKGFQMCKADIPLSSLLIWLLRALLSVTYIPDIWSCFLPSCLFLCIVLLVSCNCSTILVSEFQRNWLYIISLGRDCTSSYNVMPRSKKVRIEIFLSAGRNKFKGGCAHCLPSKSFLVRIVFVAVP